MTGVHLQSDLFRSIEEPALPLARPHPMNPKALAEEDCFWERHDLDSRSCICVGVGRTATGFYAACRYRHPAGGAGGPVFITGPGHGTFAAAREAAIARVLSQLQVAHEKNHQKNRDALGELIRRFA